MSDRVSDRVSECVSDGVTEWQSDIIQSDTFIHTRSRTHSHTKALGYSLTHSLIYCGLPLRAHSYSLRHSSYTPVTVLTHSLTHSLSHSLTRYWSEVAKNEGSGELLIFSPSRTHSLTCLQTTNTLPQLLNLS